MRQSLPRQSGRARYERPGFILILQALTRAINTGREQRATLARRLSLFLLWALLGGSLPLPAVGEEPTEIGRLYRTAQQQHREGDSEQAERLWQQLLLRAPRHFNTHLALGELYQESKPEQSLRHLERAGKLRPGSAKVHFRLGEQLERMERLEEAAEAFRQAIRINARFYGANKRLRGVLRKLRAGKTVVQHAAEEFRINPSLANLTLLGKVVMGESTPNQALWEFESLRGEVAGIPEINLWVARAHRRLGSLEGEIGAYSRYLQHDREAVGVRLMLLERLVEAGMFRRAAGSALILEKKLKANGVEGKDVGRLYFLNSRLAVARGDPVRSGELLLLAGNGGFEGARVTGAYRRDVSLYPAQAGLWLSFATWLESSGQQPLAADAYLEAGKLDKTIRPRMREALLRLAELEQAVIPANLALGELAHAEGAVEEAIARLKLIPPGHQADRRGALLLGLLHRQRGELDKSLEAFTRYVFSFPDRAGIAYARGKLFWEMKQPDVATAFWRERLEELTAYPDALIHMAGYLNSKADEEGELSVRGKLRDAAPDNLPNRLRLGELLERRGRLAEALVEWEQVAGKKSGDFALLVRLGKGYLTLGDEERAVTALSKAAQVDDLEPDLSQVVAHSLMKRRRFGEALDIYGRIYEINPQHPELAKVLPVLVLNTPAPPGIRLAAAGFAQQAGRPEQAVDILEEMLAIYPEEQEARLMLAGLFLVNDEPEEAERVILEAPGGGGLTRRQRLQVLAEAQQRLGKLEDLIGTLSRIREMEPDNQPLIRRLALLQLRFGHHQQAHPLLLSAIGNDPGDKEVLRALARVEMLLGKVDQAVSRLEGLLQLEPDDIPAQTLVIETLLKGRRWKRLTQHLERWVAANPHDGIARSNLITAYLQQFKIDEAKPHYIELKRLNPRQANSLARYFP